MSGHLKEGWQQQAWDAFQEKFAHCAAAILHKPFRVGSVEGGGRVSSGSAGASGGQLHQKPWSLPLEKPGKLGAPKTDAPQMNFFE